jgi:pyrroloquinoline-quinone synthase
MTDPLQPWSRQEFEQRLRDMERYYHINHPYHVLMHQGTLTKPQIQGWVANRFFYQISIPRKDAAIMANCPDRDTRRLWVQRILDHDGYEDDEGGIEAWVQLGIAVGMNRDDVVSLKYVLPGVRFAVEAYLNFARTADWHEAAASSLTEMFAPKIHQQRLDNWPDHYSWISTEGLSYFRKRLSEARRDVEHGLEITLDWFKTREQQEHALTILKLKLDILWAMADAMYLAYIVEMPPYNGIGETTP